MRERMEGTFHEIQNTGRNLERLWRKTVLGLATHGIAKMTRHTLKLVLHRGLGIDGRAPCAIPQQPYSSTSVSYTMGR